MLGAIAGISSARSTRPGPSRRPSFRFFTPSAASPTRQVFYGGVPETITARVYEVLDDSLGRMTRKFTESFGCT
jgi:hypothetical protein